MCDLGGATLYLNYCNTTITEMISACVLISLRSETHHAMRFTSISFWGPSMNIIKLTLWSSKISQYSDHEDDFRMHLRTKTHHAIHFTSFFYGSQVRISLISLCLQKGSHAICHVAHIERECSFTAQQVKQASLRQQFVKRSHSFTDLTTPQSWKSKTLYKSFHSIILALSGRKKIGSRVASGEGGECMCKAWKSSATRTRASRSKNKN